MGMPLQQQADVYGTDAQAKLAAVPPTANMTPEQVNAYNQQQFAFQQAAKGAWGTPAAGNYLTGGYAFDASAQNALESNAQRQAEAYKDYQYGGRVGAADDFNKQIAGTQATALQQGSDLQSQYGQAFGNATAAAAANARNPNQFLSQGDLANAGQDRSSLGATYSGLYGLAQAPQGPSAAQAQLQLGTNQAMANQIALARSGRGLGESASAMRNAQFQNAAIQQNASNQSAMLRAQETQAYRANQLAAYGSAGNVANQMVAGDLSAAQYQSGTRLQAGLGYSNLVNQSLNNGASAAANLYGMQNQAGLGYYGLQNQVNSAALQGTSGYEGNLTQNYGIYDNYQVGSYHPNTTTPALIGAGGAVLGAAAGSMLAPGPGTAAGAAAGGTLASAAAKGSS